MKYRLLEDHKIRLSDVILKAGVYTLAELVEYHKHDSLDFCLKHTKLKDKLVAYEEEVKEEGVAIEVKKLKRKVNNDVPATKRF